MPRPIIQFKDISFSYQHEPVLEHINVDINPGEYIGVIGPNGGGKTTLIKLLLGLLQPQKGTIRLWDTPLQDFSRWRRIGYVPQRVDNGDFRLPITVEEVVRFGGRTKQDAQDAIERIGIAELARRPLAELSGGQQQKAFIAKALAGKPEVLILDEPTAGVDVKAQDDFYQLIAKLNTDDGMTIIMVSHDIDVVVNEVSKLICLNETLIYHGVPKDFIEKDYLTKLYGKTRKFILHGH
jgi:zinc transport system ATP-binding protein